MSKRQNPPKPPTDARARRARRDRDVYAWRLHLQSDGYTESSVNTKVGAVAAVAAAANVHPLELTPTHVRAHLLARRLVPSSRRTYLRALRQYAAWARIPDPTAGIRTPAAPLGRPDPVGERQLARLMGAASSDQRLWILLGAFCGLRAHETAKIRGEDIIEQSDGSLCLRVEGKGGKFAILDVPDIVADDLRPRLHTDGYLFPGRTKEVRPVRPKTVSGAISRLAKRNGIKVRYHQMRHRFGTEVHRLKGDLLLTQQVMRHNSPTSTAGYALVVNEARTAVVRALPVPFINSDHERPAP